MKKYSVYDFGKGSERYTIVVPSCVEDRRNGISAYTIYADIDKNPYDGHYYYSYYHGERKVGEKAYYGRSITRKMSAGFRAVVERILREDEQD